MRAAARALCALALSAAPLTARAAAPETAWPQWLGPSRNGVVAAPGTFARGTPLALRVAWRRPAGAGVSGLVVTDGRVVAVASDGESDHALALSAAHGSELWRTPLDPSHPALDRGPVSTPAVGGGFVYVLSAACRLRALAADTGRVAWTRDLKVEFGVELRQGCQTSPLLEGGHVLVQGGGRENDHTLLAFDAATGAPAWSRRGAQRVFYTSPVAAEVAGTRQVVVHHTLPGPPPVSGLVGFRLDDRALLWERTLPQNASFETPLLIPPDRVLLLTWNDAHVLRVSAEAGRFRAEPEWRSTDLSADVSPPVLHENHLYGFGGDFLVCVDARTGRLAWKEKLYRGSLILVDGHLVVLPVSSGVLRVVEATPAGYREKARLEVLNRGARAETPPSFAGGRVFVRNDEELVAVALDGAAVDAGSAEPPVFWGGLAPGAHAAGFRIVPVHDPSRPGDGDRGRSIPIALWYPARTTGAPALRLDELAQRLCGPGAGGLAAVERCWADLRAVLAESRAAADVTDVLTRLARQPTASAADAPPAAGRFPVVLFDTGLNAPASFYFALAEFLATHGYVAACIPSRGLTPEKPLAFDLAGLDTKVQDIGVALDALAHVPETDSDRLALAGWSVGSAAAALAQMRHRSVAALASLDGGTGYRYGWELMRQSASFDVTRATAAYLQFTGKLPNRFDVPRDSTYFEAVRTPDAYRAEVEGFHHAHFVAPGGVLAFAQSRARGGEVFWPSHGAVARLMLAFLDAFVKRDPAARERLRAPEPEIAARVTLTRRPG